MKFLHTADLHLGKTVNEFSLLEDQKFILDQITAIAQREQAEAVLIAGDVYDRSVPPAEAVRLLDAFLTGLAKRRIPVLLVSGNHDSPQRLSFAEEILEKEGIYIAGALREAPEETVRESSEDAFREASEGELQSCLRRVTLRDEEGEVEFVLLPFVRPEAVGAQTGEEAVKRLLENSPAAEGVSRRVLVTHYFVTAAGKQPELSDSETAIQIGGVDNVDVSCFAAFDYTALGHIHKPQQIGAGQVWYAGAPLAYSFSEAGREKSVNLVNLTAKDGIQVRQIPLQPLHPMRKLRGTLEELLRGGSEDYLQALLTDETELLNPMARLRSVYPNLMQIVLLCREAQLGAKVQAPALYPLQKRDPEALFEEFAAFVTGEEPEEEQRAAARQVWRELREKEEGI